MHGIYQRMSYKSNVGSRLSVRFGFKRENRSYTVHISDNISGASLVPCPYGRSNVVNHRYTHLAYHMRQFHIKSRIVHTYKNIRFLFFHYPADVIAQPEKKGNMFNDFHNPDNSQVFNIINNPYSGSFHGRPPHSQHFDIRMILFQLRGNRCGMHISGRFSG